MPRTRSYRYQARRRPDITSTTSESHISRYASHPRSICHGFIHSEASQRHSALWTRRVLLLAAHRDSVVRTVMIVLVTLEDIRHISDDALSARVILSRTVCPLARIFDMHLAAGMNVSQGPTGANRDWILLVVDVREMEFCIDVVGEGLVSDPRQAVPDCLEADA
jgi:hypothetical protein